MTKRNKIRQAACLLAAVCSISLSAQKTVYGEDGPSVAARAAVLMDGDNGRVLYGKNEAEILPMASTTKLMTCILALECANLEDAVTVSRYAASMPDVQLNIKAGERYRMEDLLYSLMLESHNDSAVAIAEHVGGSVEGFSGMMNQKARDIGCLDTFFITPNGLDAEKDGKPHSTTARDLAALMRYCMEISPQKEEFLRITRTPSRVFSELSGMRSFSCRNHNALLTSMEGAVTGKTGFTNGAGYCYVGAVKRQEKTFIVALLGCGWPPHKNMKWRDVRALIEYGDESFEYKEVAREMPGREMVRVNNGIMPNVPIETEASGDFPLRLLIGKEETVRVKTLLPKMLRAPVEKGTVVGQVNYYVGDTLVASDPVLTAEGVGEWNLEYTLASVLAAFLP